jgi:uncharacterized membrane protein YadS
MKEAARKAIMKTEEWQPVVIGALLIVLVIVGVRFAVPAFRWLGSGEWASALQPAKSSIEKLSSDATIAEETGLASALAGVRTAVEARDRAAIKKSASGLIQAAKEAKNSSLGGRAADLGKKLRDDAAASFLGVFSADNLLRAALIGLVFLIISFIAVWLGGGKTLLFLAGFPVVYILSWVSQLIAGNVSVTYWGLEYVVFALAIGLFISNVIGVPVWLQEAVRTELYIKIGLVILGAGILFTDILQAGAMGIIQALLVVAVVWSVCFWLSRKLKVDDEFAAILSSAVSICGVSAAIAACGAVQGDKKKLSYVISLTLIVAVPMMVLMPWIARLLNLPHAIAGAWMGGTLDTTASVVAAGSLISDTAVRIGSIVKFSQNVFIGVAAFILSVWWAFKKKGNVQAASQSRLIWDRFPKFVIGFLAASLLFSFILSPPLVQQTKPIFTGLRTVWFGLAFVSIGLETKFTSLIGLGKGRPALAFIGAQLFNILWTLLLAYLLFGGAIFPVPGVSP